MLTTLSYAFKNHSNLWHLCMTNYLVCLNMTAWGHDRKIQEANQDWFWLVLGWEASRVVSLDNALHLVHRSISASAEWRRVSLLFLCCCLLLWGQSETYLGKAKILSLLSWIISIQVNSLCTGLPLSVAVSLVHSKCKLKGQVKVKKKQPSSFQWIRKQFLFPRSTVQSKS